MRKIILFATCLCLILLCGCSTDFYTYDYFGVWESEDPKMHIVMDGDASLWGNDGVLIHEDGSITPIVFNTLHGQFAVFENKEDGTRGSQANLLFDGTFKVRKNALILKTWDGKEIILRKISNEIPETESQIET